MGGTVTASTGCGLKEALMTIAMWSLVLNIVIAVLVVGYGIWLRNIMSQQLQSKNAEIQALEAAIKTRDAQISALQADTAPAIIEKYKNVRTFANEMAAESQQTFDKLNSLTKAFDN